MDKDKRTKRISIDVTFIAEIAADEVSFDIPVEQVTAQDANGKTVGRLLEYNTGQYAEELD